MIQLNASFLDEFKSLDNICKDIYGKSETNKLGVTLYLEDMEKEYDIGKLNVSRWSYDYEYLKEMRNLRNELIHNSLPFDSDTFTSDDIEFIVDFKERLLSEKDPLTMLRKLSAPPTKNVSGIQSDSKSQKTESSVKYSNPNSYYEKRGLGALIDSFLNLFRRKK